MGVKTEFSDQVARSVKAELARAGKDGIDLVRPLQLSRNSIYSRLRGEKPFTTEELARTADYLGISPERLILGAVAS